jgi:negative regulator of sigma-B (phosphoserine phosphatase)
VVTTLQQHSNESLPALVERCHKRLQGGRGVVLSLGQLDARTDSLTWLAVGNVEGVLVHADAQPQRHTIVQRGGVVGERLPPLQSTTLALAPGDTLAFATDGCRSEFVAEVAAGVPPQQLANALLRRYARPSDDALVLVARYRGVRR